MSTVTEKKFVRVNPKTDRFPIHKFHHIEFYCSDAQTHAARFVWALGMSQVARSDQTTGNYDCASYVLKSNDLIFTITAPYSTMMDRSKSKVPIPGFNVFEGHEFVKRHGFAVRSIGLLVDDAEEAFKISVANDGLPHLSPVRLSDPAEKGYVKVSEIKAYGDVVIRFISKHDDYSGVYLPNFQHVECPVLSYGITRCDHIVGNVPVMKDTVNYLMKTLGFHYYAEFTTDDVGTIDSGLNSTVVSNNNHMVLMPINEPTFGTNRKSQIQTYLEHNENAGAQHIALKTSDIFDTIKEMRSRRYLGGFEFVPKPNEKYYKNARARIGDVITEEQYRLCEEYGILLDKDEIGVLLQIFTRPVGDRMTLFFEIIQRVGCTGQEDQQLAACKVMPKGESFDMQPGGCGGFGKGNFAELFKSLEDYERLLDGTAKLNPDNTITIKAVM